MFTRHMRRWCERNRNGTSFASLFFSVNGFSMNFPTHRGSKFKFATGTHTLPFIHVDLLLTVTCHAIITNFSFKKLIYGFSVFYSASRQCPSPNDDGVSGCAAVRRMSSWKKFDF